METNNTCRGYIELYAAGKAFNDAIDFTLGSEVDGEGLAFLELWRAGDWPEISKEFPEFVTKYGLPE